MRITVNTPGGNIGRILTQELLNAGATVTIISRSPDKVADLVASGARLVEGSIDDEAVLDRALEGAEGLFWLTPPPARPDFHEWAIATAGKASAAAKRHAVGRVVVLSSLGAQNGPGSGPVGVLRDVENAFKAAVANVLILRAGFFMENLLNSVGTLAQDNTIYMPVPADKKSPYVATRDIGVAAAKHMLDTTWTGHRILGVHGPADLDQNDVARILTEALGRPVRYVEVTVDQARQGMAGAGMPAFMVDIFAEMYQAIRDGRMDSAEPRTPETTTPTPLDQFAKDVIQPALAR